MSEQELICLIKDSEKGEIECNGVMYILATASHESTPISPGSFMFWIFLLIAVILVLFAGIASGLTIGLLSMDMMSLEILTRSGNQKEQAYAKRLIPLISNQHFLLVTLLLSNAIAMEALPIFLDRISTPVAAVAISVTAVLLFGEVIPQALCKRYGLAIGANLYWLVRVLQFILFPIAWPMAKVLDRVLGTHHNSRFKRTELAELVSMHTQDNQGPLTIDESTVIIGALKMKTKTAQNCMTPLDSVYMLEFNAPLTLETILTIKSKGHSRIPVYENDKMNIKGVVLSKSLIGLEFNQVKQVKDLGLRDMPLCQASSDLYGLLNMFQEGKSHMALVLDSDKKVVGIVTLEDIIEELIQEEILDEQDLAHQYRERMKAVHLEASLYTRGLTIPHDNELEMASMKRSPAPPTTPRTLHKMLAQNPSIPQGPPETSSVTPRVNLDE